MQDHKYPLKYTNAATSRESGTIEAVKKLLEQGVYVAMVAGDADYK